ncbi:uncharacterized protein LOC133188699 [Saccostrea echinata]|uniref:uncharacterized protein LOC133188699 n=1 Tax=Saccostrea echinata TaxID=191078 RepID=UPI002A83EF7B|nr:uncharacterized protein LOC133188699 [Saccostrea echinata]
MEKYSHYEDASISKDSGETNLSFTHRCIQTCLLQSRKYAGFKKDARCFCGDTYNQTFAVDQSRCSYEESCMTIYNTDYEMKPLLSVPGNNSNILEVWETNSTGKYNAIFVENIMRNPAIDQWKDRRLYHIPEYVRL